MSTQVGLEAQRPLSPAETAARRCYTLERQRRIDRQEISEKALPSWEFAAAHERAWYIRLADAALLTAAAGGDFIQVACAVFKASGGRTHIARLQPPGRRRWCMRAAWLLDVPFNDPEEDNDAPSTEARPRRKQSNRGGRRAGRPR